MRPCASVCSGPDRQQVAANHQSVVGLLFARDALESLLPVSGAVGVVEEEEVERRGARHGVIGEGLKRSVLACGFCAEAIEGVDVALRRRARVHLLRSQVTRGQALRELRGAVVGLGVSRRSRR